MTDIHSHILYGLDDGAEDIEESLEMARIYVESGVKDVIVTPHSNLGDDYELSAYHRHLELLRRHLEEEKIALALYPGMEIYGSYDAADKLRDSRLFSLNGSRYVLIEYDFQAAEHEYRRILEPVLRAGYVPVVAHVERYRCVQRDLQTVYRWYEMGCGIQVNKGSIAGRFGKGAQRAAMELLNHRLVSAVATDAHSSYIRTPYLEETVEILEDCFGAFCPKLLLEDNPHRILHDEPLIWLEPEPF